MEGWEEPLHRGSPANLPHFAPHCNPLPHFPPLGRPTDSPSGGPTGSPPVADGWLSGGRVRCNVRRVGSRSRILLGALVGLLAAAAQAGCGSSGTSSADPASLAPASTPLYLGFVLKPSGGSHGPAVSDVQRLTQRADPYGSLAETLLAGGGSHPRFQSEVRPWVGQRAGVFLLTVPPGGLKASLSSFSAGSLSSSRQKGAIVLDVSEESGARRFIDSRARQVGARGEIYRGVRLEVSSGGEAMAIVGGFAVLGGEAAVKSAIDISRGAPKLSDAPSYLEPTSDAIANAYLTPARVGSSALDSLLGGAHTAALLLKAESSSLSLEAQLRAPGGTTALFGDAGARQLQALPGGSWLALGLADAARSLPGALALLGGTSGSVADTLSALGARGVQRLLTRLASSATLRKSLEHWAGAGGLFVSGSGLLYLQAALVIDSKDPAASQSAVGELAGVARSAGATVASVSIPDTDAAASVKVAGFPAVIYVASGQGKLVVGLGRASVLGALHPSSTLATSPAYAAASSALGGAKPSLIVEFPMLASLLEAIGVTQSEALAGVLPTLKSLGRLTAGSAVQEGDGASGTTTTRLRAVLELAGGPPSS